MELLPIKFFSKREEDKQRVEGNSSKELPKWVLTGSELERRTIELGMNLDSVISSVQWENRNTPLLMQAKLNKDAHAKSHRRKIEALFSTRENNVVGLGSEDALIVKISTLSDVE